MNLPECQQPPVKACSKEAPDRPPMRGGRSIFGGCIFFSSGVAWTHAGKRFGLVTRRRLACGSRASRPNLFLHDRMKQWLQR